MNPPRRCGRKKKGFYLETGQRASHGSLSLVTYVSGTHAEGYPNMYCDSVGAQGQQIGSFWQSIISNQFEPYYGGNDDLLKEKGYDRFPSSVLFDRVGANNYTPANFIEEGIEYGFSRRISPSDADRYNETINKYGGIFAVFLFKLPVFKYNDFVFASTRSLLQQRFDITNMNRSATWNIPEWSMYADAQCNGACSFGRWIMEYESSIKEHGNKSDLDVKWVELVKENAHYYVVPFAGTWFTKATFAHDGTTKSKEVEQAYKKGFSLINLDTGVEYE